MLPVSDEKIPDWTVQPAIGPGDPMATVPPPIQNQAEIEFKAWKQGVMGSINVLFRVLSARVIVLIAVSGGIALTWVALADPNLYRLGAMMIYAIGMVGGSVWLAIKG